VTRNNTIMAFLKLEDLTGTIEVIVFPKTLDKVKELCVTDSLVIIKGRLSLKEDEPPKLICESIEPLEKIDNSKIYLRAEDTIAAKELSKKLKELLMKEHLGDTPIYIFASKEKQKFRVPRDRWVSLDDNVINFLKENLGEENVKIQE
ncbi:MAG TPA: OB-fold nucleic acid binding domain-containing protein, partial [Clostridium sp.]